MKLEHGKKIKLLHPTNREMIIVDIYPVGLFREIENSWRYKAWKFHFKSLWRQLRNREWRHVKNHFNGYLAEPDVFPNGLTRCGSGWTRRRALRDLRRQIRRKC